MWARTAELMLGIWLSITWIILGYAGDGFYLLWNDFSCFILISTFSLLSYLEKLRHIHLLNFLIGGWLIGFSYFVRGHAMHPEAQNYMFTALLLLMLSIIPTHARRPPYKWFEYMKNKKL